MEYKISSLSDIARKYIKDQILSAELKSGAKIVESDIAEALHISRAPVREALRSLNEKGIVVFSPRRGHHVLEMEREELFEIFQIRISLELQVLKILITDQLLEEADYRHLFNLSERMSHADKENETENERIFRINQLDISFHRYLWKKSKSMRRAGLLEDLFYQLLIAMNQNVASLGSGDEKFEEHKRMIEALQTNNIALVCDELHLHLKKYMVAALGELTDHEKKLSQIVFDTP